MATSAEYVRWRSMLDQKTCFACRPLHGHLVPVTQGPPRHAACRCRCEPVSELEADAADRALTGNRRERARQRAVRSQVERQRAIKRRAEIEAGRQVLRKIAVMGRAGGRGGSGSRGAERTEERRG